MLTVAAFMQLKNELSLGNLHRCLENASQWADEICIYDDGSTDGSQDVYKKYDARVIQGEGDKFAREIFNKKELLKMTLDLKPDWIAWIDGDAVYDKFLTENMKQVCADLDVAGSDGAYFGLRNLWRSPCYYRVDQLFDRCEIVSLWKNNGKLYYDPLPGLHQKQQPEGIDHVCTLKHQWIHYGFSSEERLLRKYFLYKSHGQSGWALNRLIDESALDVHKAEYDIFPKGCEPEDYTHQPAPTAKVFENIEQFNSYEEYKAAGY